MAIHSSSSGILLLFLSIYNIILSLNRILFIDMVWDFHTKGEQIAEKVTLSECDRPPC
jgi:hypothetical protein